MTATDWGRMRAVVEGALELDQAERREYVRGACAGEAALLSRVEAVLHAYDRADELLPPGGPALPDGVRAQVLAPGTMLDTCRIVRFVGAGGMGEVYEAEQDQPRRVVAVKVIKPGLDTSRVVARFRAEQQALAMMEHANIARVFHSGWTESGRPYFVMEFVRGVPITEHCDAESLHVPARLELFLGVCGAVAHAHQKAVIHRDLKPSNLLVAMSGGAPCVKVIDFGVAKALRPASGEETEFTDPGQVIGTPRYMSPEQADPAGLAVDTRSDIYSLGVVLYELLTGICPPGPSETPSVGADADPSRPSMVVMRDDDRARRAAARRGCDSSTLSRSIRTDLDWIVLKAIDRDRARRYQTVAELADDIRRHLANEPVRATPPSVVYRARKFVRRHRAPVAAGAAALATLLAGLGVSIVLYARAERERANARAEAAENRAVTAFLESILASGDPWVAGQPDLPVREVLDRAAATAEASLSGQPRLAGAVQGTLGVAYTGLGLAEKAEPLLRRSLQSRLATLGPDHPDTAESQDRLARLLDVIGRYQEAEAVCRLALATRRVRLGNDHPDVAESLGTLGPILTSTGRCKEAEAAYREALSILRGRYGADHPDVARALNQFGNLLMFSGDLDGAEGAYRESLAIRRRLLGDHHLAVTNTLATLGNLLRDRGRLDEAQAAQREALAIRTRLLGASHPQVAQSMSDLGNTLTRAGQLEEAGPLLLGALSIQRRALAATHPDTAMTLEFLARLRLAENDPVGAEAAARELVDARTAAMGEASPGVAQALCYLGLSQRAGGDNARAEASLRRACEIADRWPRLRNPQLVRARGALAEVLIQQGRAAEARIVAQKYHEAALGLGATNDEVARSEALLSRLGDAGDAHPPE